MARRPALNPGVFDDFENGEVPEGAGGELGDLANMNDEKFQDITWNIYRIPSAEQVATMGRGAPQRVWVAKKTGPVDLSEIQAVHGGGLMEFWGMLGNTLKYRYKIMLEGEPIVRRVGVSANASPPVPNADASHPAASLPVADQVAREVARAVARERRKAQAALERRERDEERRRADERFARLEQMIAAQSAAPRTSSGKSESLKDLVEVMLMMRQMPPDSAAGLNPLDLLKAAREWMDQGILLGEKREPGSGDGGPGWTAEHIATIVQSAASVLGRFTPPPRRPGPPPGAGAPATPPPTPAAAAPNANGSVAEVVTPPAAPRAEHPLERWKVAIDAVSRNMLRGRGPDETAATLEDVLAEDEVANLRGSQDGAGVWHPTSAEAMAWLEAQGLGPYPQLTSPGGTVYLDSVLADLRTPVEDEAEA